MIDEFLRGSTDRCQMEERVEGGAGAGGGGSAGHAASAAWRTGGAARRQPSARDADNLPAGFLSGWDILDASHDALRSVANSVAAGDWDLPTPCDQWTVTQVLQHAAGDQLTFAGAIAGEGGPTENPFSPSGRLSEPPAAVLERALGASAHAWASVAGDAPDDVPTPLPQGLLPARVAVGACALDAAVHAWDIAVATGQKSPLTGDLAEALMPVATAIVEPLRSYGVYAGALPPLAGDDPAAGLLRYLGRRPDWTA